MWLGAQVVVVAVSVVKGALKYNNAITENDLLVSRAIPCLAFLNYTYNLPSNPRMYNLRVLQQIGDIRNMANRTEDEEKMLLVGISTQKHG